MKKKKPVDGGDPEPEQRLNKHKASPRDNIKETTSLDARLVKRMPEENDNSPLEEIKNTQTVKSKEENTTLSKTPSIGNGIAILHQAA